MNLTEVNAICLNLDRAECAAILQQFRCDVGEFLGLTDGCQAIVYRIIARFPDLEKSGDRSKFLGILS